MMEPDNDYKQEEQQPQSKVKITKSLTGQEQFHKQNGSKIETPNLSQITEIDEEPNEIINRKNRLNSRD